MGYWSASVESKETDGSVCSMAVDFYRKSLLENPKVGGILKKMCVHMCVVYAYIVHTSVYVFLHVGVHMYEWVHVCTYVLRL